MNVGSQMRLRCNSSTVGLKKQSCRRAENSLYIPSLKEGKREAGEIGLGSYTSSLPVPHDLISKALQSQNTVCTLTHAERYGKASKLIRFGVIDMTGNTDFSSSCNLSYISP